MASNFRIPTIVAIVVFIFSSLIGMLSGVRFTAILLRSVILSVISAGFVFIATKVLENFIPELFQKQVQNSSKATETENGKKLDIKIDDPIDVPSANETQIVQDSNFFNEESYDSSNFIKTESDTISQLNNTNEDLNTVKAQNIASTANNGKQNTDFTNNELEELPDLQEFIPDEPEQKTENFVEDGTGRFDISADLAGSDMDTKNMVQAIRTVLKREP